MYGRVFVLLYLPNKLNLETKSPINLKMSWNEVDTVSLGKGPGFKGKQHHKHTASETQSPTQ